MKKVLVGMLIAAMLVCSLGCAAQQAPATQAPAAPVAEAPAAQAPAEAPVAEAPAEIDFPTKEIKLIVPWNAGGANDVAARQLQPIFKDLFGVDLVVENLAGGSSAVGITEAVNANPDGYTLGFATSTILALTAQGTVNFDLAEDFTYITKCMEDPIVFVAKTGAYENFEAFIQDCRDRPGEAIIAMSGTFGTGPIYSTVLGKAAGIDVNPISFDSGSRCVTEVLGGHAEVSCSNYGDFADQVAAGEMVVLAVCAENRLDIMPEVPTVNECGYDIFADTGFLRQMTFVMGPKGMDPAVTDKLIEMFSAVAGSATYQAFAASRNFDATPISGDELKATANEVYEGMKYANDVLFAA